MTTRATLALEQLVRQRQVETARATSTTVARMITSLPPDGLTPALKRAIVTAAAITEAGQRRSQTLAAAFVRQKVTLEIGRTLPARGISSSIAGTTVDGRPLTAPLSAVGPTVFGALRSGKALSVALQFGAAQAARTVTTEIMDAGRREVAEQAGAGGDLMPGWVWVVSTDGGCAACLGSADNEVHSWDEDMESHPWCTCMRSPEVAGAPSTIERPTGADLFAAMTPAEKVDTFHSSGDAKAALVTSGAVALAQFVGRSESQDWRGIVSERPLDDFEDELAALDDEEGE